MNVLFPGRFQPFHEGHAAIVERLRSEGAFVTIAIRETIQNTENPYSMNQRFGQINRRFSQDAAVQIITIPDIDEIVYGRDPGWSFREVEVSHDISQVRATRLREGAVIWITGQSGAGKTTLANNLRSNFLPSAIILDGDEMRLTISTMNDMSEHGRTDHNLRVARLARLLADQGHIVIVSVIAPYRSVRTEIHDKIAEPLWIYLTNQSQRAIEMKWPYEPPLPNDSLLTIENDERRPDETAAIAYRWLERELS